MFCWFQIAFVYFLHSITFLNIPFLPLSFFFLSGCLRCYSVTCILLSSSYKIFFFYPWKQDWFSKKSILGPGLNKPYLPLLVSVSLDPRVQCTAWHHCVSSSCYVWKTCCVPDPGMGPGNGKVLNPLFDFKDFGAQNSDPFLILPFEITVREEGKYQKGFMSLFHKMLVSKWKHKHLNGAKGLFWKFQKKYIYLT